MKWAIKCAQKATCSIYLAFVLPVTVKSLIGLFEYPREWGAHFFATGAQIPQPIQQCESLFFLFPRLGSDYQCSIQYIKKATLMLIPSNVKKNSPCHKGGEKSDSSIDPRVGSYKLLYRVLQVMPHR